MSPVIDTRLSVRKFDLRKLERADYNPRSMTDEARVGLHDSLDEFGMLEIPLVNTACDPPRVVGGHQRIRDLLDAGYTHADCAYKRFDETAEMAANLTLNNPAVRGSLDPIKSLPNLDAIAKRLPRPDHARMNALAEKLRKQARRTLAQSNPKAREGDEEEAAGEAASEYGALYTLGEHRLYCGDFRSGMEKLFGGRNLGISEAHVAITDPPYNLAYTSGNWFRNDKLREAIVGDDMDPEEWRVFLSEVYTALLKYTKGALYVFTAAKELATAQLCFENAGGVLHCWLVCAKSAHPLSPGDYHPQYELILWGAGADEIDVYGPARTNVIEYKRPATNHHHPAQKPLALIRELMEDATDVGQVVLDPFAGSGTTLCVAEEMERICYAAEINPLHCDTIRRRWTFQVYGKDDEWEALTET
jgi:DNA modification methylase